VLIAPAECEGHERVRACIEAILAADNPVAVMHYLNVRESMRNGASPACLRQRAMAAVGALPAPPAPGRSTRPRTGWCGLARISIRIRS